jgi:methyl-accepting chemotaxis protein
MRHLDTRTYTNVALTVLIVLLAIMIAQPYVSLPTAQAQLESRLESDRNAQQRRAAESFSPSLDKLAGATEQVAEANRDIAKAIRESAEAQTKIAKSIGSLSEGSGAMGQ